MMTDPPTRDPLDPALPGAIQDTVLPRTRTPSTATHPPAAHAEEPQVEPDGRDPVVPRIVLVPGLGLDERSSARLRADLAGADGGPAVTSDVVLLPGMGLKAPVPSLAVLVQELLARLGNGPVVLVGHSQGCQVAAVAAVDPRVTALVLFGPTTDPPLRRTAVLAGRWLATAAAERWTQFPRVVAQWLRTGPRAMLALWRRTSGDRTDGRLAAVAVPVVVVRGTRDRLCPHDWALRLVSAAPLGRLVELPGAAHMTVQTRPGEVAGLLRAVAEGRVDGARSRARRRRPA